MPAKDLWVQGEKPGGYFDQIDAANKQKREKRGCRLVVSEDVHHALKCAAVRSKIELKYLVSKILLDWLKKEDRR